MTQLLPPKKEVALALLERSNVDVYLDPRAKGVVVPPQFRKEPRLILKIGLNMPVPIPDLRLDDESMSCTLSFSRSPFYCVVPWSSVFAMVGEDGRGMVWPDDVPQELAVKVVDGGSAGHGAGRGAGPEAAPAAAATRSEAAAARRNGRATKLAEDSSSDRPSRAGAKKKKTKKKDEGRPVLVAVPPSQREASEPSERQSEAAAGERRREAADQRRPQSGQPSAQPSRADGVSAIPSSLNRNDIRRTPVPPVPGHGPSSQRRPPPRPSDAPGRPKRELPPYLRVVK
jgi:stringent starvation protein B